MKLGQLLNQGTEKIIEYGPKLIGGLLIWALVSVLVYKILLRLLCF